MRRVIFMQILQEIYNIAEKMMNVKLNDKTQMEKAAFISWSVKTKMKE